MRCRPLLHASIRSLLTLALLIGCGAVASAQIILVDRSMPRIPRPTPSPLPPRPAPSDYRIRTVDTQVSIVDQAAKVQISQVFQNTGTATLEAVFAFPLPDDAAISGLTLLVDGKELAGKLLKKEDARRIYEEIVRSRRDPALLEYMGLGLFQTSVFPIPANAERTVEIRYTQLLKKDSGLIDFKLPIGTTKHSNKPIEKLDVTVRIQTSDQIKSIYSPSHQVEINRPDNTHAVCKLSLANSYTPDDFRLLYGTVNGMVGMNLLSYRPSESDAEAAKIDRTLLFVFDKSGSMSGKKIEQAREALKFLINQLRPGDTFNIITYDSNVEAFRPELQRADDATIKAALGFAEGLYAGGSTNIDGALKTSLQMLVDPKRPSYVIFMTDGLPTVGEVHEQKIAANAKALNKVAARVYAFGVGFDVNGRLLDRLAGDHRGQSVYVKPNENIEAHVAALYQKIGAPVLTDLAVSLEVQSAPAPAVSPISRTYPRQLTDLYQGEQLVYVGRYRTPGDVKVTLTGKQGMETKSFQGGSTFVAKSMDESNAFIEKLWATRRIGEIIDELDLKGQNQELVDELVRLSTQHGILTPYTSFLADETVPLSATAANGARAADVSRRELAKSSGESGVTQRSFKGGLQRATNAPNGGLGGGGVGGPTTSPGLDRARKSLAESRGRGTVVQDAEGQISVARQVQNVGQKTFFFKENRWNDSTVTPEQAKTAQRVTQFSQEYFDLASANGGQLAKYLAFEEPLLVNLNGTIYQIDPPQE
ncbi:MAG: VIT domain-containing protein [Planctomycetota bacterium]|nr:VIT domain-containing protein [Planctomycetota bacterium]